MRLVSFTGRLLVYCVRQLLFSVPATVINYDSSSHLVVSLVRCIIRYFQGNSIKSYPLQRRLNDICNKI